VHLRAGEMLAVHALTDERVRLFRAFGCMLASLLLFGYASGAYGLAPPRIADSFSRAREQGTVTWSERDRQDPPRELTAEAVVQRGKITSLVYRAGTLVPTEAPSAASVTPVPSAALVGALVLFGVGVVSLMTLRARRVSSSALRGRLMGHLRHWQRRRPVSPSTP
jgi:hypothetical protein